MGWRDVVAKTRGWDGMSIGTEAATRVRDAVLAMASAVRIALARGLLEGTGRVVAREVGETVECPASVAVPLTTPLTAPYAAFYQSGWNACRAAMMGDE